MFRFAVDEDFNNAIVRGLLRRKPDLDIVRIQDIGLLGADDNVILEWAAAEGRILLSHDFKTLVRHVTRRAVARQSIPGVILIQQGSPIGRIIDDLLLAVECSDVVEWQQAVRYLPL